MIDASLLAENMTMAAECLGLGSVFVGSALANEKVVKLLGLPKGVLPLMLLCVGYPDEEPPTRPRWKLSSILHVDQYQEPDKEEIEGFLNHMNYELRREGYYQKYGERDLAYRYSDHIKRKTALELVKKEDSEITPVVKRMGFLPGETV
jgi:hypothetical protein